MWALDLRDRERDRRGLSAAFYAVHEDSGGVADGYVRYRFKHAWHHGLPNNEVHVVDIAATSPLAEAALWRFLLDIDLARSVHAARRPVDEPLRWLLTDPRQVRTEGMTDDLWVRLVDVGAALAARRYAVADQLTIEVTDQFRPANDGHYRLDGGPDGAVCTRTDDPADIACGVAELGAIYLGGVSARSLARAGRIEERTDGALTRLDAMVVTDPPPLCRTGF
jgi:predicted acetyltransferase